MTVVSLCMSVCVCVSDRGGCVFSQPCRLKTSGSLWSCASECRSSAPSSTAKCAGRSPRTNSSATRGEKKKTTTTQTTRQGVCVVAALHSSSFNDVSAFPYSSLQELLQSSRKLSLKVLSFVQSFQVTTRHAKHTKHTKHTKPSACCLSVCLSFDT